MNLYTIIYVLPFLLFIILYAFAENKPKNGKRSVKNRRSHDRHRRHSPHYSMPEFGYVAIKIYSAMVSGRYNRCDLYSEGNIRQVL